MPLALADPDEIAGLGPCSRDPAPSRLATQAPRDLLRAQGLTVAEIV